MSKILKQWLNKIFSDVHNAIVSIIVVGVLATIGGAAVSKNLKLFLFEILQFPTPLWLTILLVLLVYILTYLIFVKTQSSSLPFKIKFFDIGTDQKWKTKIFDSGHFEVDDNPICKTHDLPFIAGSHSIFCPEARKRNCKNVIPHEDRYNTYEIAKSYIDKKIRDKNY